LQLLWIYLQPVSQKEFAQLTLYTLSIYPSVIYPLMFFALYTISCATFRETGCM